MEHLPNGAEPTYFHEAYLTLNGDPQSSIPFWVWIFENPDSPVSLPGKIDLYRHDCLHLLLQKGFDSTGEAFVLGFTMGNDRKTNWLHLLIIKIAAFVLYPYPYRFQASDLEHFNAGYAHGKNTSVKEINQIALDRLKDLPLVKIRADLRISID